ncbi:unnamed protein product [Fraxinus pennsylvanica]|uniref:MYB transcription factor n=1 Tax=Fraxinus pennsylvanica TaxID=56036 RepID=A0AAD2DJ59_9LAMI|nr:unnamed protein product [Fraxinus pennsylvanica]
MGNPKLKWTSEEKEAIEEGVVKYGTGQWKIILNDPEFAPRLANRSNVQLKVFFMSIYDHMPPAPRQTSQANARDHVLLKSPVKKYKTMIFEAISSIKDPIGSNSGTIAGFIERKYRVPQNFRKSLSSKLRRLVLRGQLDKVQDCYKIKEAALGTKTAVLKEREVKLSPLQNLPSISSKETVEDAATIAARKIAEAQNKSLVAAEAVKESERLSEMAEDADSSLLIFKEMLEQCSKGETLLLA